MLRRRGRRGLAVVATLGIVLSASVTALLLHHGVSITRLYYGTDTRVQEVMAGALLAVAIPRIARRVGVARNGPGDLGGEDRSRVGEGAEPGRSGPAGRSGRIRSPGRVITLLGTVGAITLRLGAPCRERRAALPLQRGVTAGEHSPTRTGSGPIEGDQGEPNYRCKLRPQEDKHIGAYTERWSARQCVAQHRQRKCDGGYRPDKRRLSPSGINESD